MFWGEETEHEKFCELCQEFLLCPSNSKNPRQVFFMQSIPLDWSSFKQINLKTKWKLGWSRRDSEHVRRFSSG